MFTDKKRKLRLLIIASVMNTGLFSLSYYLHWPLWLDTTGTIYISCLLGAPLGYLAAIINNVFEAVFFMGEKSLLFYLVSMVTAFLTGNLVGKQLRIKMTRWLTLIFVLIIVDSIVAVLITFAVNGGVPSNDHSLLIYNKMINGGMGTFLSTVMAVMIIKIPDVVISVALVVLFISVTPNRLKTTKHIILDKVGELNEFGVSER